MKKLCDKVNIVPIIAKADSLTPPELINLKKKILKELGDNNITIFRIPDCDSDEDELYLKKDQELKVRYLIVVKLFNHFNKDAIPYAIIGSTNTVEVGGRKTRGRVYPWGVIDIQDESCSDFIRLKTFLR